MGVGWEKILVVVVVVMVVMCSLRGMICKSRNIYSCIHITNNVRANNITFLSRKVYTSSRLDEKNSHYDIIIAGGGMVGTTLACALG
jgi:hypothetical protein